MKRSVLAVILILSAIFCAFGQNSPIDLILLLDTSSGMASSYDAVNNYITGSFLSEFLRVGDTFHLITFSENLRLDSARRVESRGDVETIIGRMLIQYPVESGNNVTAAISYAEDYASSLPSRPKKIVILTTATPDTNLLSAARQRLASRDASLDFVSVTAGQPLTNLPSSGRASAVAAVPPATAVQTPSTPAATPQGSQTPAPMQTPPSTAAQTQSTPAATPQGLQTTTPAQTPPSTAAQTQSTQVATPQSSQTPAPAQTPPATAAQTPSSVEPSQTTPSTTTTQASPAEPTQTPTSPEPQTPSTATQPAGTSGTSGESVSSLPDETQTSAVNDFQAVTSTPRSGTSRSGVLSSSLPLIIGIIVLVLLILALIIFFASRRLGSSPNRVMASVSASKPEKQKKEDTQPFANHSKELASYAAGQKKQRTTPYANRPVKTESSAVPVINPQGPLLLNLFVEDQNTAIGKRNIHSLKSGYSLTVGGGKSDFLIFLVPIPPSIGEIHRDGSQCTFIPRKIKYFPDLGSNEVRDCINKTIRVISDKNYELRFRFEMYEDPLEALNKMLNSINVPG